MRLETGFLYKLRLTTPLKTIRLITALPFLFLTTAAYADRFVINGVDWRPMIQYAMSPQASVEDSAKIIASFVQAEEGKHMNDPEILKPHQGKQCVRYNEWPRGNMVIDLANKEMNESYMIVFNDMAEKNGANVPSKFYDRSSKMKLAGYLAYAYVYGEPPMCVCGGLGSRQFDDRCSLLEPTARTGADGKVRLVRKSEELSHWVSQRRR